jgi:hypothetical protein
VWKETTMPESTYNEVTRRYLIAGNYLNNQTQEGWDQLVYQMDREVRRTNRYAVVQVNPTIHGTDEAKGITLARGLTHREAVAWKTGLLTGLALWAPVTIEDDSRILHHQSLQETGILVCPEDRAPADPSDSEDTTDA